MTAFVPSAQKNLDTEGGSIHAFRPTSRQKSRIHRTAFLTIAAHSQAGISIYRRGICAVAGKGEPGKKRDLKTRPDALLSWIHPYSPSGSSFPETHRAPCRPASPLRNGIRLYPRQAMLFRYLPRARHGRKKFPQLDLFPCPPFEQSNNTLF